MMRYTSEVDFKKALGIEPGRTLSKDEVVRFLEALPEIDQEVALALISGIPEITTIAKLLLEDAAKAHDAVLASNAHSQEILREVALERLSILRAELDKDLSPEERMRVFDDVRDVHSRASLKDTENKKFLAEQSDRRGEVRFLAAATFVGLLIVAMKSGRKARLAVG